MLLIDKCAELFTVEQLHNGHLGGKKSGRCTEVAVKYIENLRPPTMKIKVEEINGDKNNVNKTRLRLTRVFFFNKVDDSLLCTFGE